MKYSCGKVNFICFVDSSYVGDVINRKSISAYGAVLGNAVCSWGSETKPTVAWLKCEAEYHAITRNTKEAFWIS